MGLIQRAFLILFGVFLLVGCEDNNTPLKLTSDTIVTMENLDDYLFRSDVQYVDLRNFAAKFHSGYIEGFDSIPFFEYLDYRVFDRNDSFDFQVDHIVDELELFRLFDRDKAIFLHADGCIRSAYVAEALLSLGYERVYVLGGFYEYMGDHLVLGTGDFIYGNTFYASHVSSTSNVTYVMYGEFNMGQKILSIHFDWFDGDGVSMRSIDYDPATNYDEQLTSLENYIVDDLVTLTDLYRNIMALETSGYDDIPGYQLGFDADFVALFESMAISP